MFFSLFCTFYTASHSLFYFISFVDLLVSNVINLELSFSSQSSWGSGGVKQCCSCLIQTTASTSKCAHSPEDWSSEGDGLITLSNTIVISLCCLLSCLQTLRLIYRVDQFILQADSKYCCPSYLSACLKRPVSKVILI